MMISKDADLSTLWKASWPLILYLVAQLAAGIWWASKIESRVSTNEERLSRLEFRLDHIDEAGTRRLAIVEDRQQSVLHRLDTLSNSLDAISRYVMPHALPSERQQ